MHRHLRWITATVALAVLCASSSLRAADVDTKLLPDDTKIVAAVHVRQALESPLGKKFVVDKLHEALKSQGQVEAILKELGFDPFKDLDLVVFAGPGGQNPETGVMFGYGKYDVAKFHAKAEEVAKTHGDHLAISKIDKYPLYEVTQEDGKKIFVVIPSKDLVLASPAKDALAATLKKMGGADGAGITDAHVKQLLTRVDTKQTIWFVASMSAVPKGLPLDGNPKLKEGLENAEAVLGGVTVGDDVKLALEVVNKDAASARQLSSALSEGLNQLKQFAGFAAQNKPEAAAVVELLGAIKVGEAKDKSVLVNATFSNELVGKLVKLVQGGQ